MSGLWYFWGSLALLLGGYFVYGAFVEKVFGADFGRLTPVKSRRDGVDYIELPRYKIFLIQLLNIAGLGPGARPHPWGAVRAFRPALGRVRLHFRRRGA